MNIKRNIIFALESRKKNGVAITENVPIRMRGTILDNVLSLRCPIVLMPLSGMPLNKG